MLKVLNNPILSNFYTLICVLSLNWFLPIFDSLFAEASMYTRVEIIGYLVIAISLELILLAIITKYYHGFGSKHLKAVTLAVILAINLTGFLLSFSDPFVIQPRMFKVGEFILLICLFYGLSLPLDKNRIIVGGITLLYLLVIVQQISTFIISKDRLEKSTTFDQFKAVKFKKSPNVYILSFDALMPPSLALKNLGLKNLAYVKTLEQIGARRFKNTFSDQSTTMSSLPLVYLLDPALWDYNVTNNHKVFSGLAPSPLLEIFRNNGYKISTGYAGNYKLQGKYINEFLSNAAAKSYCDFALPWFYMQHLGYCSFKLNILNNYFTWAKGNKTPFMEQVLNSFEEKSHAAEPWLNFIYFGVPGHVAKNYSHADKNKREKYTDLFEKNEKITAEYIQLLTTKISRNDPDGIILFFGDHGPWLSRGLDINEDTVEFIVQDRHGVLSAIYPGDACSLYMPPAKENGFVTPSGLVRKLITCLSNGDDPIDWDVDYSGPYKNYKFSDFIYE